MLLINPYRFVTSGRVISSDADVNSYLNKVEANDNQQLEQAVIDAVENFVLGCKSDGLWSAIKASCILAGARTLSGALVPLIGTAPTNFNFVSADYNRETGLKGNGSSKRLRANRLNNADPQNSKHFSLYVTETDGTNNRNYFGGSGTIGTTQLFISSATQLSHRVNALSGSPTLSTNYAGFIGSSRGNATSIVSRGNAQTFNSSINSQTPSSESLHIFSNTAGSNLTTGRISFYSIGESLDIALLDSRVSTLMTALAAAIP